MKRLVAVVFFAALAIPALVAQTEAPKVPDAAQFVGQPKGKPMTGAELERRAHEVSGLLRCPVCQGLSVADSKAEMAINMKGQVHDLLARGYTEEQILSYFEQSYGQFVLLKPKFEGMNVMVWLLPVLALIGGALIVLTVIRKLQRVPAGSPATDNRQPTTSEATDPYLEQVRQLVGGKK